MIVDQEDDIVQKLHGRCSELDSLKQVADNAQKQYVRSRGQPSPESIKRAKQLPQNIPLHPIFQQLCSEHELETTHLLDSLKSYKPTQVLMLCNIILHKYVAYVDVDVCVCVCAFRRFLRFIQRQKVKEKGS